MKRADLFKILFGMLALIVVNSLAKAYISEYAPVVVFITICAYLMHKCVKDEAEDEELNSRLKELDINH